MKARTRFGPVWVLITLVMIFLPMLAAALFWVSNPALPPGPWLAAPMLSGFVLLIIVMVVQMPWRDRLFKFGGSTIRMVKVKKDSDAFALDAGRPYAGFIAIREGLMGKNSSALGRWLQASLEQDGKTLLLEFEMAQVIRPSAKPYDRLPGPEACDALKSILGLDFVLDETALDRAANKPPSAPRGKARFIECIEGPGELVAFLKAYRRTNTWRREGKTSIEL